MTPLKTMTSSEFQDWINPELNKLPSIDQRIYTEQLLGNSEIVFNPPILVPNAIRSFLQGAPYNFDIESTTQPDQKVLITKISWI